MIGHKLIIIFDASKIIRETNTINYNLEVFNAKTLFNYFYLQLFYYKLGNDQLLSPVQSHAIDSIGPEQDKRHGLSVRFYQTHLRKENKFF